MKLEWVTIDLEQLRINHERRIKLFLELFNK